MAFVFHVEFGMNDTPLTQALEQGNYASAERLILDCPNSSYLDDGCYQRTPLYICLCGVDQYHQRVTTRNLYLARVLIEHGANVNKRVPVTNFGSEYISPGKSSLELLVHFFIELTQGSTAEGQKSLWRTWNPTTELVVGLNKQYLTSREDVKEDVLDLIFNILRHGGDPNIQDEHRRTPVHHASRLCLDPSLLQMLHTNGGSLAQMDNSGNCPLMALCSVDQNDDEEEHNDVWELSSTSSAGSRGSWRDAEDMEMTWRARLKIPEESLTYLIMAKEIDVNHQNNLGQTPLFHAIIREDMSSAHLLLEAGANPSIQAFVWKSRRKKRKMSALFASLMSLPLQRSLTHSSLYDRMVKPVQPISTLVDAGYFSSEEMVNELSSLIASDFSEFSHLCPIADSLLHLMFGYKSASLKQLTARKIFQCCLLENTTCIHTILPVTTILENYPAAPIATAATSSSNSSVPSTRSKSAPSQYLPHLLASNPGKLEEYLTLVLNCTVLHKLTQLLQLPTSLQLNLEAQLLYLRMLLKFSPLTVYRPAMAPVVIQDSAVGIGMRGGDIARFVPGGGIFRIRNNSDNSEDEDEDNDSTDDSGSYDSSLAEDIEGDSDLEYW